MLCIKAADGATVYNQYVPPQVCYDMPNTHGYVAYIPIKTWAGPDFLSQLYFRIGARCMYNCVSVLTDAIDERQAYIP
ncbi:MAG: hypothetical protein M3421_04830 [Bacteroidota bacterium]|nr:hypothetical protein [Bacteroidota bacterium]